MVFWPIKHINKHMNKNTRNLTSILNRYPAMKLITIRMNSTNKINLLQVSDKTVKARVTRMIEIIDCDMSTSKLYQKAFAVMQCLTIGKSQCLITEQRKYPTGKVSCVSSDLKSYLESYLP